MHPMLSATEFLVNICVALLTYTIIVYPAIMFARAVRNRKPPSQSENAISINIIIPVFNEENRIVEKLKNCLEFERSHLSAKIIVGFDGCSDDSFLRAQKFVTESLADDSIQFQLVNFAENRGKASVLNDLIRLCDNDVVLFSDASAILPSDTLKRISHWFSDENIGAVGLGYAVGDKSDASPYWRVQSKVKAGESSFGALIGAHGAAYAIRRALYWPITQDTVNDDFVIPVNVMLSGYAAHYDPGIVAVESDTTSERDDFHRRRRIAAGNVQQFLYVARQREFWQSKKSWMVISGKGLRILTPFLAAIALLGSIILAPSMPVYAVALIAAIALLTCALIGAFTPFQNSPLRIATYIVKGLVASAIGSVEFLLGVKHRPGKNNGAVNYVPAATRILKRSVDIIGAIFALALTAPLTPLIAIAILVESPGPILFRQLRVGRRDVDRTLLFEMIKFRTMRNDAEKVSGAVWARKNDPRITRVGRILRKTRLDEIPQMINVLRGEMSLIGPRPERPGFYSKLERGVPFYAERTYGLRPGVTGLAQVCQGYDETIEDVRNKAMYDHAYAASLTSLKSWICRDAEIIFRTLGVMVLGRGQ